MTRRAFSLVPLSRTLDHLIPALTDTHNAQWAQLCLHWDRVVGPALASCCRPKKIMMASKKQSRGVLHLAVWDGKALEIGYQSLTICDRVNAYFGFQAVHQVRCASSAPPMPTCPRLKPPFASSDPLQMANFFQQLRRQLDTDSGTEESQREDTRR